MIHRYPFLRAILFTLILTTFTLNVFADSKSQRKLVSQESQDLLSELVKDPEISEIYRLTQLNHLGTTLDIFLEDFFMRDPVLSQLRTDFIAAFEEQIKTQITSNLVRMTKVSPNIGKKLYDSANSVMRRLGFNEEQIKNADIFTTSGQINAYTFGISKDKVVIVVYTDLVEKSSPLELEAILGHELMHILGQHVLKQFELNLLMNRIVQFAMSKKPLLDGTSQNMEITQTLDRLNENFFNSVEAEMVKRAQKLGFFQNEKDAGPNTIRSSMNKARESYIVAMKRFAMLEATVPASIRLQASQTFLNQTVSLFRELQVPQEIVMQLQRISRDLPTGFRPNVTDLIEALERVASVTSQQMETSADIGGLSTVDPLLSAKFDLKVSGGRIELDNEESTKSEREKILAVLKSHQDQFDRIVKETSAEDLAEIMNGDNRSHPFGPIRAVNQLYYSRNHDVVALRNPFLRLVALSDAMTQNLEQAKAQQAHLEAYYEQNKDHPQAKEFQKMMTANTKFITQFEKKTKRVQYKVSKLVVGYDWKKTSGLEKEHSPQNPRLVNLLEYRLLQKAKIAIIIQNLEGILKDGQLLPNQPIKIQQNIKSLKAQLGEPDALLSLIQQSGLKNPFFDVLNKKDPTLEQIIETLEKVRASTGISNLSERASRADLGSLDRNRRTSALKSDAAHAADSENASSEGPSEEELSLQKLGSSCLTPLKLIKNFN